MPVLDPLQTPEHAIQELDWEDLDLKGRNNLVVGKPWAPLGLYALLPENLWNPVICEMYLVVPRDAEVHLFVHKATIVSKDVELKSLSVQGDFVLDSRPEHLEFLSNNLSISDTLLIASSMGRIGLHDLNIGSQANVTVSAIDGSIDITSLAAPNLEIQSVNKAVCLVGPMASLNTSSRPFNNATLTVYSSSWECPTTTQVPCPRPSMKLVSTGRGAVAFHALSVDVNGARSEIPQPASRSNMSGSTTSAGLTEFPRLRDLNANFECVERGVIFIICNVIVVWMHYAGRNLPCRCWRVQRVCTSIPGRRIV
jgi:hypothetical protein